MCPSYSSISWVCQVDVDVRSSLKPERAKISSENESVLSEWVAVE